MTNKQILEKAIKRAEKNGFDFRQIWKGLLFDYSYKIYSGDEDIVFNTGQQEWKMNFKTLLFDHNFAKAFWGNKRYDKEVWIDRKNIEPPIGISIHFIAHAAWAYHIQKMALKEEPLKYLKQFLK